MMKYSTKKLAILAILLALCVIGANIKILGSIALDSFPAFIGAIILGPAAGAFLGFFGHMISALPNTLPIHLIIAVLMAACMFFYSWTRKKLQRNKVAASIISMLVAYVINVPLDLLLLYPLMGPVVFMLFVPLTLATVVNLTLSEIVILGIPQKYKEAIFLK